VLWSHPFNKCGPLTNLDRYYKMLSACDVANKERKQYEKK